MLDTDCSSTVAGESWFETYLSSLDYIDKEKVQRKESRESSKIFKFGGGERLQSLGCYIIPAVIAGKVVSIKTDVVKSDIPLLLSLDSIKKVNVKMDVVNDTAEVFGVSILLNYTSTGHYCIPIDKKHDVPINVFAVRLEELNERDTMQY